MIVHVVGSASPSPPPLFLSRKGRSPDSTHTHTDTHMTTTELPQLAPFPLTDDNSRLLGVGERLVGEVYERHAVSFGDEPMSHHWFRLSPHSVLYGKEVPDDSAVFYRVLLSPQDTYTTGAVRNKQEGRGRYDLIPFEAMDALAKRLEMGAAIYGDKNWEKGIPLSRFLSSMRRHAAQVNYDFSEDHLGAVLFNAAGFVTVATRIKAGLLPASLDDLGYLERQAS
jgi:hypothetical protein